MEQNAASFALEFDFKGSSQICVVDYDTDWIDVFAMVKCSLELEDIQVKYVDDESDEVNLNSEAEYSLARELARKQGNVLKFNIYRKSDQSASFSTMERKVKPVGPPPGSIYDSVTGCAVPGLGEYHPVDNGALASINMSEDTMSKMKKKPPDQFVNNIVQDILQGLDGSVVLEEDAEEFKVTQRKIRQGIKEKNQSSNIEWSPSCTRIPKGTPVPSEEFVNKVVRGVLSGLNGAELRSAMENENNRRRAAGVIHEGVKCNNCRNRIVGIRYKCVHCPNFDLCSSCEAVASSHDENHVFLKLYKPVMKGLGLRFDNQPIPLLDIPIYPTDEGVAGWEQKKLRYAQKIAYKIAKAEMKFKRKEEKRKRKEMGVVQVSPTKRERLEKMVTAVEDGQREESSLITGSYITKDKLLKDWTKEYNALLLGDVNIPSGTHLQPGTKFTKSWRVLNGGDIPFDDSTSLKFLWGNIPNLSDNPVVPHLHPGQEGILSVECEAPRYPGTYQSTWRLVNNGCQFGQRFTCNIVVDKAELLEPKEEKPVSVEKGMLIVQAERALEASEAVANLQPGQSDSSSPNKIISNNTDLLTAQDILSFEMLKISKKGEEEEEDDDDVEIEVQAVPTPNNTPCGMTPCMSPVPQLDAECLSSKISDDGGIKERVVETRIEEVEEQSAATTNTSSTEDPDLVIVDHKSEDTASVGSADEDLLGDFFVVPLPDCFDLSKPLEECVLSTSTMKAAENDIVPDEIVAHEAAPVEVISDIDSMLATSHTLIQTPLVPLVAATPIQPQVEMVPHTIVTSPGTYTAPEIVLDVVNISDNVRCGFVVSPDQDAVPLEVQSETAAVTEEVIPSEDDEAVTDNIEAPVSDENGNSLEVETPTDEEVMENCHREREVDATEFFHDAEESNISPPREEGAEIPREMMSDTDGGSDPQKEDEEEEEEEEDVIEERTGNLSSYQLPPQGHDQAREILGMTAARAAQVASSVMKQAYDVANSAVTALLTPPSQPQSPLPSKDSHPNPMDTLIEMGFANRERNKEVLYKYNNDVNQCVQELLSEDVENWHLTRH